MADYGNTPGLACSGLLLLALAGSCGINQQDYSDITKNLLAISYAF